MSRTDRHSPILHRSTDALYAEQIQTQFEQQEAVPFKFFCGPRICSPGLGSKSLRSFTLLLRVLKSSRKFDHWCLQVTLSFVLNARDGNGVIIDAAMWIEIGVNCGKTCLRARVCRSVSLSLSLSLSLCVCVCVYVYVRLAQVVTRHQRRRSSPC